MTTQDGPRILVIDDELPICQNCMKILSRMDVHTVYALNGYDALAMMEEQPFDVLVTDLKMSRLGGMEVLRKVGEAYPETLVIVITGYASVSSAVEVMKLGAFDYLPKPFTPEELRGVVGQALAEGQRRRQNLDLMSRSKSRPDVVHQLIGDSPRILKVIDMVRKVAPTDSTVLVCGESGTGKELIARAIHANSNRREKIFFAVDCGTLSGNLLESELFGHTRGAFTGAHQDKPGIFQRADGGTVFLDEIGNIPLDVQAKLLRFLESREFIPLGGTKSRQVDIRLIFATNQELQSQVEAGNFREDFYYRIYVYPIRMPPLRERKEDVLPIAYHFLEQFNQTLKKEISGFEEGAAERLTEYEWPGNVRQLKNMVERAVILCDSDRIGVNELPFLDDIQQLADQVPETNDELKRLKKTIRQRAVQNIEKNFVLNALMRSDWNVTRAAKQVGLQRTNFQALMRKHGVLLPRRSHGQSD